MVRLPIPADRGRGPNDLLVELELLVGNSPGRICLYLVADAWLIGSILFVAVRAIFSKGHSMTTRTQRLQALALAVILAIGAERHGA